MTYECKGPLAGTALDLEEVLQEVEECSTRAMYRLPPADRARLLRINHHLQQEEEDGQR